MGPWSRRIDDGRKDIIARVQLSKETIAGLIEGRRLRILLQADSYAKCVSERDASLGKLEDEGVTFKVSDKLRCLGAPLGWRVCRWKLLNHVPPPMELR